MKVETLRLKKKEKEGNRNWRKRTVYIITQKDVILRIERDQSTKAHRERERDGISSTGRELGCEQQIHAESFTYM